MGLRMLEPQLPQNSIAKPYLQGSRDLEFRVQVSGGMISLTVMCLETLSHSIEAQPLRQSSA